MKKRCIMCGCYLSPSSESNICECCADDMYRVDKEED